MAAEIARPRPHRVPIEERDENLKYYHANKELMNLQSYLGKINRTGRTPRYAQLVAYHLYKDAASGKWCFPPAIKELMKHRSHDRQRPPMPIEPADVQACG